MNTGEPGVAAVTRAVTRAVGAAGAVGAVTPLPSLARNLVLTLSLALVLAACAGAAGSPDRSAPAAPSSGLGASASTPSSAIPADSASVVPDSPAAGIIASIDSAGLDQVRGFTLRTSDGQVLTFVIGILENGAEFPPGHLAEHFAAASPILVYFRVQGGQLVVYRIEDAG